MASASDKACEFVNQYSMILWLDDRYDDPYCDRFLYSLIAPGYINDTTPPKPQALAHRDTPALTP